MSEGLPPLYRTVFFQKFIVGKLILSDHLGCQSRTKPVLQFVKIELAFVLVYHPIHHLESRLFRH